MVALGELVVRDVRADLDSEIQIEGASARECLEGVGDRLGAGMVGRDTESDKTVRCQQAFEHRDTRALGGRELECRVARRGSRSDDGHPHTGEVGLAPDRLDRIEFTGIQRV